ncbi:amidohydrolase [Rhodococcus sp. NPDC060176]|uniref:amidohydrolase n=1 Tax=Rhodococcus sp. NPDC060176 TaxID=3347062 RepID=UPI003652F93D
MAQFKRWPYRNQIGELITNLREVALKTTFVNGTVWRGLGHSEADRLLVIDGRVAEWDPAVVPDQVVDLSGGFLGPAFGDGHAHPLVAGLEAQGPQVREATDVEEMVQIVANWAVENPDSPWIIGGSYDATLAEDGRFDARWLDAAVPDRPVVLRSYDHHAVWCNTRALQLAGITDGMPDPDGGTICRRKDGSVLGTLLEWGAVDMVFDVAPPATLEAGVRAAQYATEHFAALGITWVQDAWVDPGQVEVWLAADQAGVLACRADLAQRADPKRWKEQREELTRLRDAVAKSSHLSCRTIKFFVDGIMENRTAHMLEDYSDSCCRGMPVWEYDDLLAATAWVDSLGFELHLHAIGDAAVRSALDAVEHVIATNGPRDRRPVIAHAQLVHADDLNRFAALSVIACFQPLWATADDFMVVLTLPHLGEVRGNQQYQIRSLVDSGAPVSYGSDWPVTSPDVLLGLRTAITRQNVDGTPEGGWIPSERISLDTALDLATRGVAYQARADHERGILTVGRQADLVWLSSDPRAVDITAITDITVLGTWLEGHRTHAHQSAPLGAE